MNTLLLFPLITWMSMCVICIFLSAWSVGKGVCPYCVTAGHTPWLVKTQWQVVPQGEAHVTGEEIMLWWSSMCVLFPVWPCRAVSSGGQPGPVMWGVSMVPPTHWSQVKTTHPKKCFQGSVSFSNVPVSLLNSRCSCLYDGCISISFITSAVLHTHTHEPCIPQNDVWSQNGIIKKVFQEKATQWHFPQMQYIQCPLLLLFFKTLHAKIPSD